MVCSLSCRPLDQLLALCVLRCIVAWWNKCQLLLLQCLVWTCHHNKRNQFCFMQWQTKNKQQTIRTFPCTPGLSLMDGVWTQASCNINAMLKRQHFTSEAPIILLTARIPTLSLPCCSHSLSLVHIYPMILGVLIPCRVRNKSKTTPSCRVWCPFGIPVSGKQLKPQELVSYSHAEKGLQETERK